MLVGYFASRLSREYRIVVIFDAVRVVFLDTGTRRALDQNAWRPVQTLTVS